MTPAPTARRHPPTTTRLDALVDAVREAVGLGMPPDITAYLVGERLAPHLADENLLTAAQRESDPSSYRRGLLHAEPDGSFSLVSLVWLPGRRTDVSRLGSSIRRMYDLPADR